MARLSAETGPNRHMELPATIIISAIGMVIAIYTAITSARKSRVDNLVAIIDAQAKHIKELDSMLHDLQTQLDVATKRITELESENRRYRRKLLQNCIDPDEDAADGP